MAPPAHGGPRRLRGLLAAAGILCLCGAAWNERRTMGAWTASIREGDDGDFSPLPLGGAASPVDRQAVVVVEEESLTHGAVPHPNEGSPTNHTNDDANATSHNGGEQPNKESPRNQTTAPPQPPPGDDLEGDKNPIPHNNNTNHTSINETTHQAPSRGEEEEERGGDPSGKPRTDDDTQEHDDNDDEEEEDPADDPAGADNATSTNRPAKNKKHEPKNNDGDRRRFVDDDYYRSRYNQRKNTTNNTTSLPAPFEHHDGVVVVTKIHGRHQLDLLDQSLCLLHHAYNHKPLYDLVVFSTLPVSSERQEQARALVAPANLTFVVDNAGLQEEIAALPELRRQNFLAACNVSDPANLTWWSECPGRIAYNWQAEFRTTRIWTHPALSDYHTMLWLDTDAFCTQEWKVDPVHVLLQEDLVILFDNWPKGSHSGKDTHRRIWDAFGVHLCKLRMKHGHFERALSLAKHSPGDAQNPLACKHARVPNVHGFFHVTNLEFFREPLVQKWTTTWIGDGFLQRRYDDQAGVTIPAAILAPNRSWEMRRNNITLGVYHNFDLDGKKKERVGGFKKYWKTTVQKQLPKAAGVCPIKAAN